MSNKFKNIANIYFDDGEAGKIGDAVIYNMSFSQGYSSEASQLTISAVSEDGNYTSVPSPNFDDVYVVKIESAIIFKGFILRKELKATTDQKVISVVLIDKSIRLDQNGIGLVQRHGGGTKRTVSTEVEINQVNELGTVLKKKKIPITRNLVFASATGGGRATGTVYILGNEKWTSNPCDMPDVEYDSGDLATALASFSNATGMDVGVPDGVIQGRNYTGTIREVLNSICSDSGQTFYYSSSSDTIIFAPLNAKAISHSLLEGLKNDPNIIISEYTESESLENTYANFVSIREMRPGRGTSETGTAKCVREIQNHPYVKFYNTGSDSGLGPYTTDGGMLSLISGGLRDFYWIKHRHWDRVGFVNMNFIGSWGALDVHCLSDNPDAPCSVDTFAAFLNIPSEEARSFICNNPSLHDGFEVYQGMVDETGLKDFYVNQEKAELTQFNLYTATWKPVDLMVNSSVDRLCNHREMTQEPQPEFIEETGIVPGWYFKGSAGWQYSQHDLGPSLEYARVCLMDVTANMAAGGCGPQDGGASSYLIFIPNRIYDLMGDVQGNDYDNTRWGKSWAGSYFYQDDEASNCVPLLTILNTVGWDGSGISDSPCAQKCADLNIDTAFLGVADSSNTDSCGNTILPAGEVCAMQRFGIEVYFDGFLCVVGAPWYSLWGYRSNIITTYSRNASKEVEKKTNIEEIYKAGPHFAKLNINDIDATSEIFDPRGQSSNYVTPVNKNVSLGGIVSAAHQAYGHFGEGSSVNGIPMEVSFSIVGLPSNVAGVIDQGTCKQWDISFSSEGITMSVSYSDTAAGTPTMDYLQSKLYHQYHYTMAHGQ